MINVVVATPTTHTSSGYLKQNLVHAEKSGQRCHNRTRPFQSGDILRQNCNFHLCHAVRLTAVGESVRKKSRNLDRGGAQASSRLQGWQARIPNGRHIEARAAGHCRVLCFLFHGHSRSYRILGFTGAPPSVRAPRTIFALPLEIVIQYNIPRIALSDTCRGNWRSDRQCRTRGWLTSQPWEQNGVQYSPPGRIVAFPRFPSYSFPPWQEPTNRAINGTEINNKKQVASDSAALPAIATDTVNAGTALPTTVGMHTYRTK
jgi:hypothetical protein